MRWPSERVAMIAILTAACWLCSAKGAAAAGSRYRVLVVAAKRGELPRDRAVNARLGEAVDLYLVVCEKRHGQRTHYYTAAPRLALSGKRVSPRSIRSLASLSSWQGQAKIVWYRIEPRPHHVKTKPHNAGMRDYANAVLYGKNHGKWIDYDTIEYHETRIANAHFAKLTLKRVVPTHPKVNVHGGLGTMRYKVTIRWGAKKKTFASPGLRARTRAGISRRVARVTFRSGDTLAGWLRGFFNVPTVFGSAGRGARHQTELYQGTDCADVLVGAARAAGAKIPYTSVAGLARYTKPVTARLLLTPKGIFELDGTGRRRKTKKRKRLRLRFGKTIRSGDIVLIDYVGSDASPRSWDHVAMIDRDAGERGIFDPRDPLLHTSNLYGLVEEPALEQAPAIIRIVRFRRLRSVKRR